MTALIRAAAPLRRLMRGPSGQRIAPCRHMSSEVPPVSWSEYRDGSKTLAQWVDANRHKVAGGMFAFYASLAAWSLRPKKAKPVEETPAQ